MARIRTIKPETWDDELLASLPRDTRLLFIGLWNFADDEGRLRWSAPYIKSKVFPYDDDLSSDDVAEMMAQLVSSGRVRSYSVDGHITQSFAVIVNFARHQRINRAQDSSLPAPPPENTVQPPVDPPPHGSGTPFTEGAVNEHDKSSDLDVSHQPRRIARSTPEGKGRERKGKEGNTLPLAELADPFVEFWSIYPRKVDKRIAAKAYRCALRRGASAAVILEAAKAYAAATRGTEVRYIKHPSSWLNAASYDNPTEPLRLVAGGNPGGYQAFRNPPESAYDEGWT